MHPYTRRLQKEFKTLSASSLAGVVFVPESDLTHYKFEMSVDNPLYQEQKFLLRVDVDKDYPVEPPIVRFSRDGYVVPLHPHVYSNGHICLNILGIDWTPACSIEGVILSIQSMLANNELGERPPDDNSYVSSAPRNPKHSQFAYHDDNV